MHDTIFALIKYQITSVYEEGKGILDWGITS